MQQGLADVVKFGLPRPDIYTTFSLLLACIIWACLLPELTPHYWLDRGIFVSVGERLLAGDTLYSGVFDNKEPLFYYFVALQRWLGPTAEVVCEFLLIAISSVAVYFISDRVSGSRSALVAALIAVPIILTGPFYYPGYTHLPGICLCLIALALSSNGCYRSAGIALGILLFTKMMMLPLAASLVAFFAWQDTPRRNMLRVAIGAGATIVLCGLLLIFRSELFPFIEALKYNWSYSQGPVVGGRTVFEKFQNHFGRVAYGKFYIAISAIFVALLIAEAAVNVSRHANPRVERMIVAALVGLVVSLLTLGVTGLWDHHNQILYIPAILAFISVSCSIEPLLSGFVGLIIIPPLIFLALPLGGSTGLSRYGNPLQVFQRIDELRVQPKETGRLLAFAGSSGTYARFGPNNDGGHAFGLRQWKLMCPKFQQYAFEPEELLHDTLVCASSAPVLIISDRFMHEGNEQRWNKFVDEVEVMLAASYVCDVPAGLRICRRKPALASGAAGS